MADNGPVTEPVPTGRPNARLRQTVGDMVRSLVLVLLVVGLLVLLARTPEDDPVKVVDVSGPLSVATAMAPFPVLMPAAIEGYRATSARFEPTEATDPEPAWHVGWVSAGGGYVQLGQAATADPDYLEEQLPGGRPAGEAVIEGIAWQRYETPERRMLARVDGTVTTALSGTEPWTELERVAASLAPAATPGAAASAPPS